MCVHQEGNGALHRTGEDKAMRYWNTHINSELSMTNLRSDVPKLGIFNRGGPINCSAVCLKKRSIPICKWTRSEGMSQLG